MIHSTQYRLVTSSQPAHCFPAGPLLPQDTRVSIRCRDTVVPWLSLAFTCSYDAIFLVLGLATSSLRISSLIQFPGYFASENLLLQYVLFWPSVGSDELTWLVSFFCHLSFHLLIVKSFDNPLNLLYLLQVLCSVLCLGCSFVSFLFHLFSIQVLWCAHHLDHVCLTHHWVLDTN